MTDIPGTTRDAIEAVIDTPALPLRLVDTAGMREATETVERIGVEVSASYVGARRGRPRLLATASAAFELLRASLGERSRRADDRRLDEIRSLRAERDGAGGERAYGRRARAPWR